MLQSHRLAAAAATAALPLSLRRRRVTTCRVWLTNVECDGLLHPDARIDAQLHCDGDGNGNDGGGGGCGGGGRAHRPSVASSMLSSVRHSLGGGGKYGSNNTSHHNHNGGGGGGGGGGDVIPFVRFSAPWLAQPLATPRSSKATRRPRWPATGGCESKVVNPHRLAQSRLWVQVLCQ
jgi:hypothetical protein